VRRRNRSAWPCILLRRAHVQPGSADAPQICKLLVRLPSGDKVSRRFDATDPLQALLDFVALQGYPRHDLQLNFPLREVSAWHLE